LTAYFIDCGYSAFFTLTGLNNKQIKKSFNLIHPTNLSLKAHKSTEFWPIIFHWGVKRIADVWLIVLMKLIYE
jgi:hypothetical protein